MLQDAIARWRAAGFTTYPVANASALASCPHAHPARVESLIEDADAMIAAFHASKAAKRRPNPVGVVIHGLSESESTRGNIPSDIPLIAAQRWEKLRADRLREFESTAAIQARIGKLRELAGVRASKEKSS